METMMIKGLDNLERIEKKGGKLGTVVGLLTLAVGVLTVGMVSWMVVSPIALNLLQKAQDILM